MLDLLIEELREAPHGLCKRRLQGRLLAAGETVSTRDINSVLYSNPGLFYFESVGNQRVWSLRQEVPAPVPITATRSEGAGPFDGDVGRTLELYEWQTRALAAWHAAGERGVVQAVTGSGKTRLALAAIAEVLLGGGKAAVLVPTLDLVRQWENEIHRHLPRVGIRPVVGRMGGGSRDDLATCDLLVATSQSAAQNYMLEREAHALLVADECHRYGSEAWALALEPTFDRRLGLTATYEREDDGVEDHLAPYFGGVCYDVDYREALDDDVIAPFKLAFVGVPLALLERRQYEEFSRLARKYRRQLILDFGLPDSPFGEFMREVQQLKSRGGDGSRLAGFYLSAFTKRRSLLAGVTAKYERLAAIVPSIQAAERTIVFAQTREAASAAVGVTRAHGIAGATLDATMDVDERKMVFAAFETGESELVAAPKLLDEGIDVPSADLAIVLASSRSRRQLIQRLGRVVRKKPDGRCARLALFYVEGTYEDPAEGAHEAFLDLVRPVAADERIFSSRSGASEINRFLSSY